MNSFLQISLILSLACSSAFSQTKSGYPSPCDCRLEGILYDPDPTGTNVRSAPNGRIVATLRPEKEGERVILDIIGHRAGWLKVLFDSQDSSKSGWVYGELIGIWFMRNSVPLYKIPDRKSQVVAYISETYDNEDEDHHALIVACRNSWAFVKARSREGQTVEGWLAQEDQCANPYTTCAP